MSDHHFLRNFIITGNLSSLGLLIFVLTDSLALAIDYSITYNKNEEMTRELKDLNENLEIIIKERTKKIRISNDKIQEQKKELEKANIALQNLSHTDSLTNLWNRRYFDEMLDIEWKRALRGKLPLSLFFIDIDNFKAYNDQYGHSAGDNCLIRVAKEIKNSLKRAGDMVARYGGEEFVVLLSNTDLDKACKTAEIIRMKIEELAIPSANAIDKNCNN